MLKNPNSMLFGSYPKDLIDKLKDFNANMEVEKVRKGIFRLNLRSHFNETKHIMVKQRWHKNNYTKVWAI